jgi:hypothetical protein
MEDRGRLLHRVLALLGGLTVALIAGATFSGLGAGGAEASGVAGAAAPGVTLKSTGGAVCSGGVTFLTGNGTVVDTVTVPAAEPASASDPVLVAAGGSVVFSGTSGIALRDYRSTLAVDGLTLRTRGGGNAAGKITRKGTRTFTYLLPHLLVGTFYVSGAIEAPAGGCTAAAYVKLTGSPYATVGFYLAALLVLLGLLGLFMSMPSGTVDRLLASRR